MSNELLAKAEQYIASAQVLANIGDFDSATSRLYYAMFYIAGVLLDKLDLRFSSHHAVIAAYGKHFAKTQILNPRFHRMLIDCFEKRQLGDYTANSGLDQEDVDGFLLDATEFLTAARQWLNENPVSPQSSPNQ